MKTNVNYLRQRYKIWSQRLNELRRTQKINVYIKQGRKPWSEGYSQFKEEYIQRSINDLSVLEIFQNGLPLPKQYGEFLDDRAVEYPWLISCLEQRSCRILDAGSALNFSWIIKHPKLSQKDIAIVTLEPEIHCYWQDRVSYVYGDLRNLPFRDDWFDEVVSISTIEHIGMNNSLYSNNQSFVEREKLSFLKAVSELKRVTKPGGKVYITVPYGKYTNFGWYQQFNAEMVDQIVDTFAPDNFAETYFCYESGGWSIGDKDYCQKFDGFNVHETKYFNEKSTKDYDPDYAAASRAVAALELWK